MNLAVRSSVILVRAVLVALVGLIPYKRGERDQKVTTAGAGNVFQESGGEGQYIKLGNNWRG